jgi:hypothetical protein
VGWLAVIASACGGDAPPIDVSCKPQVVYLNRAGGMFDHGPHDDAILNLSVVVDAPRLLPPWPRDDWAELVACIETGLAPFARLAITDVDPGTAAHIEIVFTTSYWGDAGTTMLVPSSCRAGHQVELVFGDAVPTTIRACHVALQGFALMTAQLSLDDNCRDFVNNHQDCSPERAFLDETANCVDASNVPVTCRCAGGTTENTYRALEMTFPACPG